MPSDNFIPTETIVRNAYASRRCTHVRMKVASFRFDDVHAKEEEGFYAPHMRHYATQKKREREKEDSSVVVHMRYDGDSKHPPHSLLAKLRHSY